MRQSTERQPFGRAHVCIRWNGHWYRWWIAQAIPGGVKGPKKPNSRHFNIFLIVLFNILLLVVCAETKHKKFEQPTELLVAREGKTKSIRVTVGLFVWRKEGLYTIPWVQHSAKKKYMDSRLRIGWIPNWFINGSVVCSLDLFLSLCFFLYYSSPHR